MSEVGRNDPCPCGSGKKYKKCCLAKEEAEAAQRREEANAIGRGLDWLWDRYPEATDAAVSGDYFGGLEDEEVDALRDLPPGLQTMLEINIGEWLLADAAIEVGETPVPVRELLLGAGGPLLPAQGHRWIRVLVERPLGLYEVRDLKPDAAVEVQDLLRPDLPPVWVRDRVASREFVRWDVLGARLVGQDAEWLFSGALYPLDREAARGLRDRLLGELEGEDLDGARARARIGAEIRTHWLRSLVAPQVMPALVDRSTGEPIVLTTDHYRVTDWPALEAVLSQQPDVEGDRAEGWVRFVPLDGETRRSLAALNGKEPDGLEVVCRTVALANETRAWLKRIAGKALARRGRELVDPRSPKAQQAAASAPQERLPPELEARLVHEFFRKHYENWTEEPIPALGQKSPREAMRTPQGRQAVIDLLKSYEQHEAREARRKGVPAFDYGFLWERLGIEREGWV